LGLDHIPIDDVHYSVTLGVMIVFVGLGVSFLPNLLLAMTATSAW
jgi:hypothetical protein